VQLLDSALPQPLRTCYTPTFAGQRFGANGHRRPEFEVLVNFVAYRPDHGRSDVDLFRRRIGLRLHCSTVDTSSGGVAEPEILGQLDKALELAAPPSNDALATRLIAWTPGTG
jgi:hypothetical protein